MAEFRGSSPSSPCLSWPLLRSGLVLACPWFVWRALRAPCILRALLASGTRVAVVAQNCGQRRASLACPVAPRLCAAPCPVRSLLMRRSAALSKLPQCSGRETRRQADGMGNRTRALPGSDTPHHCSAHRPRPTPKGHPREHSTLWPGRGTTRIEPRLARACRQAQAARFLTALHMPRAATDMSSGERCTKCTVMNLAVTPSR